MDGLLWILRRHGVIGSGVRAANHLAQAVSQRMYSHERHMWYACSTAGVPLLPLSEGLVLQRGGQPEIEMLSDAGVCSHAAVRKYLARGADLWLVREEARAAFSCWVFRRHMPVMAARGGWQALPAQTVCLEDSVTAADYRGRGIAPAAWSSIAHQLHEEGIRTIVTKVEEANTASRKAVLKAGFREMAVMDRMHIGGLSRMHLELRHEVLVRDLETLVDMQKLSVA